MSAGRFVRAFYASRYGVGGNIHPIRVQPETIALVLEGEPNGSPTGPASIPISAYTSKGVKEYGLSAIGVNVRFTDTIPDGYSGDPIPLPLLNFDIQALASQGAVGTYLGNPIEVVSVIPERVR